MKKSVVVIVVLVVLLLVAPFAIGRLAEKRLNVGLDKLVEAAPYITITDRKWTGGWFTSQQEVTFELSETFKNAIDPKAMGGVFGKGGEAGDTEAEVPAEEPVEEAPPVPLPETAGEPTPDEVTPEEPADESADESGDEAAKAMEQVKFTVRNDVLHGPVLGLSGFGLARVDSHLVLPPEVQAKIKEVFGEEPALEVRTRVGFFGGGTTTFKSEGRTIKPEGDTEISYETMKVSVGVSRNADSYDLDGKWPKVTAKSKDGGSFVMSGLTLDGDGERVFGDLYDGDFEFRIKEVTVKEHDTETVVVHGTHYIVESKTKDDFVTMSARLGTGEIKSPQIEAAGVEIKEIHYDFSLRRLHAKSLEKLSKALTLLYVPGAQVEEVLGGAMKEHGVELLKHDPEFSIDRVGLVTPDGELVAKGVVKFVGATPEDFSVPGALGLIAKIHADITVEAGQKVVDKFPNGATMAGAAVDAGYAKREGDKLVCHIVFKDGELTVNGKPQAIPALGGPPAGGMEEAVPEEGGDLAVPPQE